jgi:hypothetical protein
MSTTDNSVQPSNDNQAETNNPFGPLETDIQKGSKSEKIKKYNPTVQILLLLLHRQ